MLSPTSGRPAEEESKVVQERSIARPMIEQAGAGLAPLIASWQRHLRAGNKSEATISAYRAAADGLDQFLASQGMPREPGHVAREHVEAYIAEQLASRSAATAHQRYRSLLQLFKWLLEEGEINHSPM